MKNYGWMRASLIEVTEENKEFYIKFVHKFESVEDINTLQKLLDLAKKDLIKNTFPKAQKKADEEVEKIKEEVKVLEKEETYIRKPQEPSFYQKYKAYIWVGGLLLGLYLLRDGGYI